jgi:hypothetical protein
MRGHPRDPVADVLASRSASASTSIDASTAATVEGYQRPPLAVSTRSALRSFDIAWRAIPASRSAAMRARTDSGNATGRPGATASTVLFTDPIIHPPAPAPPEANDPLSAKVSGVEIASRRSRCSALAFNFPASTSLRSGQASWRTPTRGPAHASTPPLNHRVRALRSSSTLVPAVDITGTRALFCR